MPDVDFEQWLGQVDPRKLVHTFVPCKKGD
jgi:hypothetical protein